MKKTTCLLLIIFSIFFVGILILLYQNINRLNSSSDLRKTFVTPSPVSLPSCNVDGHPYLSGESFTINNDSQTCICQRAVITCYENPTYAEKNKIPTEISSLYQKINQTFAINLTPIFEDGFNSPSEIIDKKSWKLNFPDNVNRESLTNFLLQQLQVNEMESNEVGSGRVDAYQNSSIKCFHVYGYDSNQSGNLTNPFNYLTCIEK